MAQEVNVDFSDDFLGLIFDGEIDDGTFIDPDVVDEALYPDKPQNHGYEFTNMFNLGEAVDLTDKVVSEYGFDDDMNFIGFTILSTDNKQESFLAYPNAHIAAAGEVDSRLVEAYDTTRVIGFRTTKQCRQAKLLKNKMKKAHEDDSFLIHAKTATSSNVSALTVRRRLQEHRLKTIKPA